MFRNDLSNEQNAAKMFLYLFKVPYACTGGFSVATALTSCMKMPSLVSTTYLETLTNSADVLGTIDNTAHLSNDRIWIFDGINDTKVNPGSTLSIYFIGFESSL